MRKFIHCLSLFLLLLAACRPNTPSATAPPRAKHSFTDSLVVPTGAVRTQHGGTCWAYGVVGMWESEALAAGERLDLSELWLVRAAYYEKGLKFVRTRGRVAFSQGGELSDAEALARQYGLAEEGWIDSLRAAEVDHGRLLRRVRWWALKTWLLDRYEEVDWEQGLERILDEEIAPINEVSAKSYSFGSHRAYGSYLHHPFYSDFTLEVPDNWMGHKTRNLPLDELMATIDASLRRGCTVGWNADTSERGFRPRAGVAELPPDSEVTPEARQEAFDRGLTTDDHIMQIVGIAYRDDGRRYYKVRNSWGPVGRFEGFFYASEAYVRMKTIEILVKEP